MDTLGLATCVFEIAGARVIHEAVVVDSLPWDVILGVDFLERIGAIVNLRHGTLSVKGCTIPFVTSAGLRLPSKYHVCFVDEDAVEIRYHDMKVDSDVGEDVKMHLLNILSKNKRVFMQDGGRLGRTDVVLHQIDTGDAKPVKQPARRIPVQYRAEVEGMINDMLANKVIRPSNSPWASPVVLVKKKDGSLRLCVDYRKLNQVTRKDSFPLPRIDETIESLDKSIWFSTLDLASGYWQVEVHPTDKEKTAFAIPSGLYEFETMPFGLTNAPATFQRLMQTVLKELIPQVCLVYIDDIIIHSRTIDEHFKHLQLVFDRLLAAGLKLKPSKCCFLRSEVKYLGHIIGKNGVRTDPAKIEQVRDWPVPANATEVKSFLGLASYYRKFVQDFATGAA